MKYLHLPKEKLILQTFEVSWQVEFVQDDVDCKLKLVG